MAVSKALRDDLLASIPNLRAFAVSLTGNSERADDLVQETLDEGVVEVPHLSGRDQSPRLAVHHPQERILLAAQKARARGGGRGGNLCGAPCYAAVAERAHGLSDFRRALVQLPPDQREALVLVGASGFSYEEAAEICGCAVGTIKSRVSRARNRLGELLGLEPGETHAADALAASVTTRTIA